jgi:hypothetical protein
VKKGFCSRAYQEPGPVVVTREPRLPTIIQKKIAAASFRNDGIVIRSENSMTTIFSCPVIILWIDHQ